MKKPLVLGAGAAGTMAANRLVRRLGEHWQVTVVDLDDEHHYQPGYLFVPSRTSSTSTDSSTPTSLQATSDPLTLSWTSHAGPACS